LTSYTVAMPLLDEARREIQATGCISLKTASAIICSKTSIEELYALAAQPKRVDAFYPVKLPNPKFPPISVTGTWCQAGCKYCGGYFLRHMHPAKSPERLWEVCTKLAERGAKGFLISGGYTREGKVPILRFLPVIKRLREELDLSFNIHTGVLSYQEAKQIAKARVDVASVDLIASNTAIKELTNLSITYGDYEKTLENLEKAGVPYAPHICIGLYYGRLKGEVNALRILSRRSFQTLVLLALVTSRRIPMKEASPPPVDKVAKVMLAARLMFPDKRLVLGCMRPGGQYRKAVDQAAVKLGVDGIVQPAVKWSYSVIEACCALEPQE